MTLTDSAILFGKVLDQVEVQQTEAHSAWEHARTHTLSPPVSVQITLSLLSVRRFTPAVLLYVKIMGLRQRCAHRRVRHLICIALKTLPFNMIGIDYLSRQKTIFFSTQKVILICAVLIFEAGVEIYL